MKKLIVLILSVVIFIGCCKEKKINIPRSNVYNVLIPNKEVALFIAEPILLTQFGERILFEKPFEVYLKNDSIWVIQGTRKKDPKKFYLGGLAYIEINKYDCRVIKVSHPI